MYPDTNTHHLKNILSFENVNFKMSHKTFRKFIVVFASKPRKTSSSIFWHETCVQNSMSLPSARDTGNPLPHSYITRERKEKMPHQVSHPQQSCNTPHPTFCNLRFARQGTINFQCPDSTFRVR
jgi:hypothetical protein